MDRLTSEILLPIFKRLESLEMIKVMRVCKRWLEIIDGNQSLWRELILPDRKKDWSCQPLKLFDKKSCSSLRRVSMRVDDEAAFDGNIPTILKRSSETLQVLHVWGVGLFQPLEDYDFRDFPNLVEFRVFDHGSSRVRPHPMRIVKRPHTNDEDEDSSPHSQMKVLWVENWPQDLRAGRSLASNLVSLLVYKGRDQSESRSALEQVAHTLVHLDISIHTYYNPRDPESIVGLPKLTFPSLKIAKISASSHVWPRWMEAPTSCTLMFDEIPRSLPSCSRTWIDYLTNIDKLANCCPILLELRLETRGIPVSKNWQPLESMLEQRKMNVEAGLEVEGVKMIPLQTLVVPFKFIARESLSRMRMLVEEVVDRDTVSRFIELEIV